MLISFLLATYNEKETIVPLVERILATLGDMIGQDNDLRNLWDRNKNEIAGLNSQMSACLGSIDTNTLKTIAKEIAAQAVEDPERAESPHDAEKREEKAEALDVARAIRDSLDAIAKDIIQEIAERRVDMV